MISSMNQVGSVKICITRCGRSHDTQISLQLHRPKFYVYPGEGGGTSSYIPYFVSFHTSILLYRFYVGSWGGRTFMSKTLFILFGIHAHKKVKRALFTVLQHTHAYIETVDLHELFVSSRKGGRFFSEA